MGVMISDLFHTLNRDVSNIPVKFISEEGLKGVVDIYWSNNDPAHNVKHLIDVLNSAQVMCEKLGVEYNRVIEFGCMFHDAGMNRTQRSKHHIHAAIEFLEMVERVMGTESSIQLTPHEISSIVECIVNHRSSNPDIDKCSIEAKVVHASDKGVPATTKERFIEKILSRSVKYHMSQNYAKRDDAHVNAYNHIMVKYSHNGYVKFSKLYNEVFKEEIEIQKDLAVRCVEEEWRYED